MEHENKSNYPVHVKNKSEYKKSSLPYLEVSEDKEQIFLRGVHCDEISTGWIEFDVFALKHEPKVLAVFGLFDHQDLLGNHRQDLKVNPVELIKAAPASRLSQSGEELP